MEEPIVCQTTGKVLAKRDEQGIWLWCKACKQAHFIPWGTMHSASPEEEARRIYERIIQRNLK